LVALTGIEPVTLGL